MGKREGRASRTARMIHRMRVARWRQQRTREPRQSIAPFAAVVEALTGELTDQQRADAEAALAIAPNDPQGTLL